MLGPVISYYLQSRLHTHKVHIWSTFSVQMDSFLTFWTDLADFLHIVLGAVVDGVRDSALADGLMLAG